MEYLELITEIKNNSADVIGVKVPSGFQWSMLAKFRKDLPEQLVLPIDQDLMIGRYIGEHIFVLVEEHQKYFPGVSIVMLHDSNQPYPTDYDLVLYEGKEI